MLKHEPFHAQKDTKSRNRRAIINILKENPSTFSELHDKSGLSRPILTQHLKELSKEQMITREISGRRIVYSLTQRGKTVELIGTKLVSESLSGIGALISDPGKAELLSNMGRMAKEHPDIFQVLTDWILNVSLYLTSDPVLESRWLRFLAGDKEAWMPFEDEIKRRTANAKPETREDFKALLENIQDGIRCVFEKEKGRKTRR